MFKQSCQIIKSFSFLIGFIYLTVPTVTFSKDFNKFSKVTFSINNLISETIIGYYENYSTNPKRAFVIFNLNGDLCEGSAIIQSKSTFKFRCKVHYSSGSYFPSSNYINAMGDGYDSKSSKFMFRIHGNGTASQSDFLKSINKSINIKEKNICEKATTYLRPDILSWRNENIFSAVAVAKFLNLTPEKCEVVLISSLNNNKLCQFSITKIGSDYSWDTKKYFLHVKEAKRRGLDCGVKEKKFINKPNIKKTIISDKIKIIEEKCTEIGFKKGTEKYGDCVLKMIELK